MARLLVFRHGPAVERDSWAPRDDADRPLTDRGRKLVRRVARKLRRHDLPEGLIVSSPWTRARETAEILRDNLGWTGEVVLDPALAGNGTVEEAWGALKERLGVHEMVAVVGHEPGLSRFASWLCTGSADALFVRLRKAGWCLLEVETAQGPGAARMLELRNPRPFDRVQERGVEGRQGACEGETESLVRPAYGTVDTPPARKRRTASRKRGDADKPQ